MSMLPISKKLPDYYQALIIFPCLYFFTISAKSIGQSLLNKTPCAYSNYSASGSFLNIKNESRVKSRNQTFYSVTESVYARTNSESIWNMTPCCFITTCAPPGHTSNPFLDGNMGENITFLGKHPDQLLTSRWSSPHHPSVEFVPQTLGCSEVWGVWWPRHGPYVFLL